MSSASAGGTVCAGWRAHLPWSIDGLRIIGGAIVVFGWLYVHWFAQSRSTDALAVAARRGLSPFRVARPYNRVGVDARCEIWTLCGVFAGALLGLGLGWALFDSLPVGILFASVGALIAGWHYRVVASLLAVDRHAHDVAPPLAEPLTSPVEPPDAEGGVGDGRLKLPVALACGLVAALFALLRADAHGPIALVGFVAVVLFVAWRVMRITDRRRAA